MTKNKVKPEDNIVSDHLLLGDHSQCFESFIVLIKENRTFVLELTGNIVIIRDKLSLKRNVRYAPLYQFMALVII